MLAPLDNLGTHQAAAALPAQPAVVWRGCFRTFYIFNWKHCCSLSLPSSKTSNYSNSHHPAVPRTTQFMCHAMHCVECGDTGYGLQPSRCLLRQTVTVPGFRGIVSSQIFNKPWGPSGLPQSNSGESCRNCKVLWER